MSLFPFSRDVQTGVVSSGTVGRSRRIPGQPVDVSKPRWVVSPFVFRTIVPIEDAVTMRLVSRGAWDPDTSYHAGAVDNHELPLRDVVTTSGGTYAAWRSSQGVAPPNPEFWAPVISAYPQYTGNGYAYQARVNTYGITGDWPDVDLNLSEEQRIGPGNIIAYSRGPRWKAENYENPDTSFSWGSIGPPSGSTITSSILQVSGDVDIIDGPPPFFYPGGELLEEHSPRLHMRLDFTIEHTSPWSPRAPR